MAKALFDELDSENSESSLKSASESALSESPSSKSNGADSEEFEVIIERVKDSLAKLNNQETSLKEALGHYKEGMRDLKKAQEMLENIKLQYQEIKD